MSHVADTRTALPFARALWQAGRFLGYALGSLISIGAIVVVYTMMSDVLYPMLSHPLNVGPTVAVMIVGISQVVGYALMGLLAFRYLDRLLPVEMSLRTGNLTTRRIYTPEFWVALVALTVLTNQVHFGRGALSPPTLVFDLVLVSLLAKRAAALKSNSLLTNPPYVLFLRPFDSFSNRSALSTILNALPHGHQALFLVPRQERLNAWDPFSVGVGGLRFLEPCRSAPVALVASDEEWEQCISRLISVSLFVFVDVTVLTPSLRRELELLEQSAANRRTVLCIEQLASGSHVKAVLEKHGCQWLGVIAFRKVLRPGRAFVALLAGFTVALGAYLQFTSRVTLSPYVKGLGFVVLGLGLATYWFKVFVKRGVGRDFYRALRTIVPGQKNTGIRIHAGLATALAAVALARPFTSVHVVAREEFKVRSAVTLLGKPTFNELRHWDGPPPRRDADAAEWRFMPFECILEIDRVTVEPRTVAWFDGGEPHLADGLRIELNGRARSTRADGTCTLLLTIPHDTSPLTGHGLVMLDRLKPRTPDVTGTFLPWSPRSWVAWGVQTWIIHDTTTQAIVGLCGSVIKTWVLFAIPLAALVAGWRVMRF